MATSLTAAAIDKLKPDPTKRVEVSDRLLPALRVVISPTGAKSYAVRFKFLGLAKKLTIGSVASFSLAEARSAARDAMILVANGVDPTTNKKELAAQRMAAARATDDLIENVVEEYLKRKVRHLKSGDRVERMILAEIKPWHGRRVQEITKRDAMKLIDKIHDRGAATTARRFLSLLKTMFSWMIERDLLAVSPLAAVKPLSREASRERVLSDAELRLVLLAAEKLGHPFGPLIKVLVLTGQRREEVAGMRWDELLMTGEAPMWSLPAPRTKNARPHDVPLAPSVKAIIDSMPRITDGSNDPTLVFTTTGLTSVSGFSKAKRMLDEHVLAFVRAEAIACGADPLRAAQLPDWRLHDLRRTFATGCAQLGVALPVVERCLNHVSGSFAGVVGVYQRQSYKDEKRVAFRLWASHVETIMTN